MLKFFQNYLASPTVAKILAWLSPMVLGAAIWAKEGVIQLAQELSPKLTATLLTLSIALVLVLVASILYLIPSFKNIPKYQFYQHRVNGLNYCPTCRNKKPLSPLRQEKTGWRWSLESVQNFIKTLITLNHCQNVKKQKAYIGDKCTPTHQSSRLQATADFNRWASMKKG